MGLPIVWIGYHTYHKCQNAHRSQYYKVSAMGFIHKPYGGLEHVSHTYYWIPGPCNLTIFECRGNAVSFGAKHAVVGNLLTMKVKDTTIHKVVNSEGYFSLATRKARISVSQAYEMHAFRLLCMLFMFMFELAPDPVSLSLILFMIGGMEGIMDVRTIHHFTPETANKLSTWPLNHSALASIGNSSSRQDPAANLVFEHLDMQVNFNYLLYTYYILTIITIPAGQSSPWCIYSSAQRVHRAHFC